MAVIITAVKIVTQIGLYKKSRVTWNEVPETSDCI